MTARISLILVVMTMVALACSVPVQVMTGTTTPTVVMTAYPETVMTQKNTVMTASVVASRSLHVRAARGVRSIVIGYLYNGSTVTLTGQCDQGWAEIVWKDGTAWVNSKFLSENKCSEEQ